MGGERGRLRLHDQPHLHDVGRTGVAQPPQKLARAGAGVAFDEGAAADDADQLPIELAEGPAHGVARQAIGRRELALGRDAEAVGPLAAIDLAADVGRHIVR